MGFITAPYLSALYLEDLADAAENVGVQMLILPGGDISISRAVGPLPVTELNTTLEGMGWALMPYYPHLPPHSPSKTGIIARERVEREGTREGAGPTTFSPSSSLTQH